MPMADLPSTDIALCFGLTLCGPYCSPRLQVTPSQNRMGLCSKLALGELLGRPKAITLRILQSVFQCVFRNHVCLTYSGTTCPSSLRGGFA